jgi:hypothetical protein
MILLQRTLYCACLVLWVLYVGLCPTWVGRFYSPDDPSNPSTWYGGGVFGLQDGDGARKRSPIWSPPRAHSAVIDPSVRWPWQRPSRRAHVELALGKMVSQLSLGVLVLGVVLRGVNWIRRPRESDVLVSVAWSISLSLVIAWLCIFAIVAFTFSYGATDGVIVTVLALGGLVGFVYGIATFWHRHSRGATAPAPTEPVIRDSSETDTTTKRATGRVRVPAIGAGLFWLTIGTFSACCLTMAGGWVASFFRGPVVGHTVLGTPRYSFDQTPVNVATGLGILATGWLLGLVMLRFRVPRALAVGLIVGTTLLGILFALWT